MFPNKIHFVENFPNSFYPNLLTTGVLAVLEDKQDCVLYFKSNISKDVIFILL